MVICKIIIQSLLLALLRAAVATPQPLLGMPKHQGMPQQSPWRRSQPEQVGHAVAWRRLSWRCWLAESSTSGRAVPSQSPCVPRSGCRASAQEVLLLRSAAPGARRGEGVTRCLPRHEQTPILDTRFVPTQAWAAWWSRGRRGGISGGSFAAPSILKQHHVPDYVCGNHQTLRGAACSHRNTGTEKG